MNITLYKVIVIASLVTLQGCGIGGHWMNGNPFPSPVIPYLQKWEKINATPEQRRHDSVMCGSEVRQDDNGPSFSKDVEAATRLPNDGKYQPFFRLLDEWKRCMIKQGYHCAAEEAYCAQSSE